MFTGLFPAPSQVRYRCLTARKHCARNPAGTNHRGRRLQRDCRCRCHPSPAQRAIADYLDRETARIDALIAAKQRMVELLEERLQSSPSTTRDPGPDARRIASAGEAFACRYGRSGAYSLLIPAIGRSIDPHDTSMSRDGLRCTSHDVHRCNSRRLQSREWTREDCPCAGDVICHSEARWVDRGSSADDALSSRYCLNRLDAVISRARGFQPTVSFWRCAHDHAFQASWPSIQRRWYCRRQSSTLT